MDPKYNSGSRHDTDTTLHEDKNDQVKKQKFEPPRTSNISTASSEDFFHLDPKSMAMFSAPSFSPRVPLESTQSQLRDDKIGLSANTSFKLEEQYDHWSQGATSPISDITHESTLENMSPTRLPPVQVMERHGVTKYDPNRIPSSAFASKCSTPVEWSAASNESLFSIRLGNNSMTRDHGGKVQGDLCKHDELSKGGDPLKYRKPYPAMERKGEKKTSEQEHKSGSKESPKGVRTDSVDHREVKFSPIEISFSSPNNNHHTDGSELEAESVVAPIKKNGCSACKCSNCKWALCTCTWPRCSLCKWPSCCSCKWPSCSCLECGSCKLPSCSSCKFPSGCSCKWPSCCTCGWPSCSSCSLKCFSCPSCSSCSLKCFSCPSCSSCSLKCFSCPSCSSCSLKCFSCPTCSSCSLKCFSCPSCSCGWPSCPSCSLKCFSWPSCNSCHLPNCSWTWCWNCKPIRSCCCPYDTLADDGRKGPQKRPSRKRSWCCFFPQLSCSWFTCRCC